jgi:LPXTG-motif cell wall-anchored protein
VLNAMLKRRAEDELLKVIAGVEIEKHQFGKVDNLISYLKEEAEKKSISSEELDKLTLRVAVRDNILTQAAVDLMAKYVDGDLKKILSDLDIYQSDLKTWTDLQEYISAKTGGRISPEELNKIAAAVLTDIDPAISILRAKILAFSENYERGNLIRQSVAEVDLNNIKIKEKWLQSFFYESVKQGLTHKQLSEILVAISSLPNTSVEQYLRDLIDHSEEPLLSSLKSLDLKKEKIKTREDLILFLIMNNDKEKYPEEVVFKSIANLINLHRKTGKQGGLWILWIVLGAGLLFFFILFRRRRKDKKKQVEKE